MGLQYTRLHNTVNELLFLCVHFCEFVYLFELHCSNQSSVFYHCWQHIHKLEQAVSPYLCFSRFWGSALKKRIHKIYEANMHLLSNFGRHLKYCDHVGVLISVQNDKMKTLLEISSLNAAMSVSFKPSSSLSTIFAATGTSHLICLEAFMH